jgi:hypothetical protein
MFETFSMGARRVVFVARLKAGQRGAAMIDLGDLLLGILLEDQGMIGSFFPIMTEGRGPAPLELFPSHTPIFPLGAPDELLEKIEKLLPQSKPVAKTIEIPISPDLEGAFDGAIHIQNTFNHKRIEPLHLLAAVLTEESNQHVKLLQDFGITKEQVLKRLKEPRPSEDE